jgi:hypothetical protein
MPLFLLSSCLDQTEKALRNKYHMWPTSRPKVSGSYWTSIFICFFLHNSFYNITPGHGKIIHDRARRRNIYPCHMPVMAFARQDRFRRIEWDMDEQKRATMLLKSSFGSVYIFFCSVRVGVYGEVHWRTKVVYCFK